jgi:hypothetical protein
VEHGPLFRHGRSGTRDLEIGFAAQSPSGEGTTAAFSSITFDTHRLAGVRDGT